MLKKTYIPEGEEAPASQIGATLQALAATIAARRGAGEESYTHRLLYGNADTLLKKVMEEAGEVALAAKDVEGLVALETARQGDAEGSEGVSGERGAAGVLAGGAADAAVDHLRYEAADVVYHLLVVLERYGVELDEFAAELNNRMTDDERPAGGARLFAEHVKRGK